MERPKKSGSLWKLLCDTAPESVMLITSGALLMLSNEIVGIGKVNVLVLQKLLKSFVKR